MPKFLDRIQLTEELQKIISDATKYLILICPYFKLSKEVKESLLSHKSDQNFSLIVVYGKNEDNRVKSMSDKDFNFFKSFPNVKIKHHEKLHAKLYVNEECCLLTSMNLHDFSMKENIEFGILTHSKVFGNSSDISNTAKQNRSSDLFGNRILNFYQHIIKESECEYPKEF